jgi:hypothetical protein
MCFYLFNSARRQFHGGSRASRAVPHRVTVLPTVKCHSEHDGGELPTVTARAVSSSQTKQKNRLIMLTSLLKAKHTFWFSWRSRSKVWHKMTKPSSEHWSEQRKDLYSAGDRTPVAQSVVRHYTDWATPAVILWNIYFMFLQFQRSGGAFATNVVLVFWVVRTRGQEICPLRKELGWMDA